MNVQSFSQHSQDTWVLSKLGILDNGYFVDVGAHEGIWISNSYMMELLGWDGICIEAHPKTFQQLRKNRKCICLNYCIDYCNHDVEYRIGTSNDSGCGIIDVDTDCGTIPNRIETTGIEHITIKTKTLDDVLKENNAPKIIDYLSVDVEGAEHRVMASINLNEYKFKTITIERPKIELVNRLLAHNYIIDCYGPDDIHFMNKDFL